MLRFLNENDIAGAFKGLNAEGEDVRIAVAFWGHYAPEALGLDTKRQARIVCNLESGATNPQVIKELRTTSLIKSNYRLHAKIYATSKVVIIGSSNASANGLALQGSELSGWIEANVMTDDPTLVSRVLVWFDALWENGESKDISDLMLEEAEKQWQISRRNIPSALLMSDSEAKALCTKYGGSWAVALDQDLFKAIYCYGQFLRKQNGNSVKQNINRHCRSVKKKGAHQNLIDMTDTNKESEQFKKLIDAKKPECTAEYIVWQNRKLFSPNRPDLVKKVYDRLVKRSVLLDGFP